MSHLSPERAAQTTIDSFSSTPGVSGFRVSVDPRNKLLPGDIANQKWLAKAAKVSENDAELDKRFEQPISLPAERALRGGQRVGLRLVAGVGLAMLSMLGVITGHPGPVSAESLSQRSLDAFISAANPENPTSDEISKFIAAHEIEVAEADKTKSPVISKYLASNPEVKAKIKKDYGKHLNSLPEEDTDRMSVVFKPETEQRVRENIIGDEMDTSTIKTIEELDIHVLRVKKPLLGEIVSRFRDNPAVEGADPDYKRTRQSLEPSALKSLSNAILPQPQDPLYVNGAQWNLLQKGIGWNQIDTSKMKYPVTIAQIDGKVDNTVNDLNDGQLLVSQGINYTEPTNPNDVTSTTTSAHATEGISIMVATQDNNGIAGIASFRDVNGNFYVHVVPYVVVYDSGPNAGYAFDSDMASAMKDAVNAGAKIISMPLGAPGSVSTTETRAAAYVHNHGAYAFIAAGNEGLDAPDCPACAKWNIPVGALGYNSRTLATFSNRGPKVLIAEPGDNIPVAVPKSVSTSEYTYSGGTSNATPHAAATLALFLSETQNASYSTILIAAKSAAIPVTNTRYGELWLPTFLDGAVRPTS